MRKLYAEMRPEIRRRHQLERAAGIARNAIVARPLETDLASYPFVAAFSVASAGFASIQDGVMTVSLPGVSFGGVLPALGSDFRRGPVAVGRTPPGVETDEIVFPAGWTLLERAPEPFVLTPPGEERPWAEQTVDAFTDGDGRLHVRLTRSWEVPRSRLFESAFAGYLRTWAARLSSASIGVVSVRWTGDGAPGSADSSEKEKQR
jgi:hypothetical protein